MQTTRTVQNIKKSPQKIQVVNGFLDWSSMFVGVFCVCLLEVLDFLDLVWISWIV